MMYLVMLWCDVDDDYHFACLCKNDYHIVLSVGVCLWVVLDVSGNVVV